MYKIVDVPPKMEKFYGKGKMLHPEVDMVEKVVKEIPKGKIATISQIADRMAKMVGVDVSCPMRTGNAIKQIAEDKENVPYWRVIRNDKGIVKSSKYEQSASRIEDEGFQLVYKGDSISISFRDEDLVDFQLEKT